MSLLHKHGAMGSIPKISTLIIYPDKCYRAVEGTGCWKHTTE